MPDDPSQVYKYATAKGGWGFEGELTAQDIDDNGGADPTPTERTKPLKKAIEKLQKPEGKK